MHSIPSGLLPQLDWHLDAICQTFATGSCQMEKRADELKQISRPYASWDSDARCAWLHGNMSEVFRTKAKPDQLMSLATTSAGRRRKCAIRPAIEHLRVITR